MLKPINNFNGQFKCPICGRFAHFIESHLESNSNYTDLVLTWNCHACGHCSEGMW